MAANVSFTTPPTLSTGIANFCNGFDVVFISPVSTGQPPLWSLQLTRLLLPSLVQDQTSGGSFGGILNAYNALTVPIFIARVTVVTSIRWNLLPNPLTSAADTGTMRTNLPSHTAFFGVRALLLRSPLLCPCFASLLEFPSPSFSSASAHPSPCCRSLSLEASP